jgi:hypothetical protein
MSVDVEVMREATDETVTAFAWLLPQLSRLAEPLTVKALQALVAWPGNHQPLTRQRGVRVWVLR